MSSDITADDVASLTDEIVTLREEVQVLRDVLDEVREELQFAVRNYILPGDDAIKRLHITSLPLDPAADDFHERVNAVRPDDITQDDTDAFVSQGATRQQTLWSKGDS